MDGVHLHEPSLAHAGIHSRCSEVNLVFVHYEIRQHTHLGKKLLLACYSFDTIWPFLNIHNQYESIITLNWKQLKT